MIAVTAHPERGFSHSARIVHALCMHYGSFHCACTMGDTLEAAKYKGSSIVHAIVHALWTHPMHTTPLGGGCAWVGVGARVREGPCTMGAGGWPAGVDGRGNVRELKTDEIISTHGNLTSLPTVHQPGLAKYPRQSGAVGTITGMEKPSRLAGPAARCGNTHRAGGGFHYAASKTDKTGKYL